MYLQESQTAWREPNAQQKIILVWQKTTALLWVSPNSEMDYKNNLMPCTCIPFAKCSHRCQFCHVLFSAMSLKCLCALYPFISIAPVFKANFTMPVPLFSGLELSMRAFVADLIHE
ncbi:hypothetical protein SRHO_G00054460 [Serrasalmus rhombeus]